QLEHERAHAELARRHLPIRAVAVRGVAETRLDRRAPDHNHRAGAQHPCPLSHCEKIMNVASTNGTATVATPVAMHAGIDTAGLAEKVSIRNLDFFYGDAQALKDINLSLYANKTTAFIGPSGCGKSTLLRILNRMYDLYPGQRATGEVILDGRNILDPSVDLNLLRARVGMVFQMPTPFPMSIYDNIAFGIRLYENVSIAEL